MELRLLEYFLAVAQEESISAAADYLHITQPTLSRQMHDLEEELGKTLFIRSNRKITLTEDGFLLRKRAGEILELVRKTTNEIQTDESDISGDIYVSASEMDSFELFALGARNVNIQYENIHFHFNSGDKETILNRVDNGLSDFGMVIEPADVSKYNFLYKERTEHIGLVMNVDMPLAKKDYITSNDLRNIPLLVPKQFLEQGFISKWLGIMPEELNIVGTIDNPYDGVILAKMKIGYLIGLDFKLLINDEINEICFRQLEPPLFSGVYIIWKKYQMLSKASKVFLEELNKIIND